MPRRDIQSGRGSMGNHKHAVSGHVRPNPRNMQEISRELNRVTDNRAKIRRNKANMVENISDLFTQRSKPKKKRKSK